MLVRCFSTFAGMTVKSWKSPQLLCFIQSPQNSFPRGPCNLGQTGLSVFKMHEGQPSKSHGLNPVTLWTLLHLDSGIGLNETHEESIVCSSTADKELLHIGLHGQNGLRNGQSCQVGQSALHFAG